MTLYCNSQLNLTIVSNGFKVKASATYEFEGMVTDKQVSKVSKTEHRPQLSVIKNKKKFNTNIPIA